MTSLLLKKITPDISEIDQIKWIEQDVLFDLMFEICNTLYDNDFKDTSFKLELVLDEFLIETNRALPVDEGTMRQSRRPGSKLTERISARPKTGATRKFPNKRRITPQSRGKQKDPKAENIFLDLWDTTVP